MQDLPPLELTEAIRDFRDARRRAALQDVLARMMGKPADLMPFDQARRLVKGQAAVFLGLQEIPLDAIIGSVGRYRDFTRTFLPRRESDESRWARVKTRSRAIGFNPIEVYRIGEAYFVLDGNHRVSIARARGDDTIQAYVTDIPTRVQLLPEDSPDDLIRKAEQADFLEQTMLDRTRADTDFTTTAPGSYQALNTRIARLRKQHPRFDWPELAARWHDVDYLPFVEMLREKGLRRDFPGRTETDLYAWIIRRQAELKDEIGWEVPLRVTVAHLLDRTSKQPRRVASRLRNRLTDFATPDALETGPRPGKWRQWALATHREDHLFTDYLVPVSGSEQSWLGLDQALLLARLEQDYVHGLHIIPSDIEPDEDRIETLRQEFDRRLGEAGVTGELNVERGNIARRICDYSAWVDLVIMNIANPPGSGPVRKLTSGLHTVIHRSPRPVILVPETPRSFERLLLAYDGSSKANEALYVSAYLAGKWSLALTVLTVRSKRTSEKTMQTARSYLERRGVTASYRLEHGDPADRILDAAEDTTADTILMGGYGYRPVLEVVIGSAVDRVLREAKVPIFLCR